MTFCTHLNRLDHLHMKSFGLHNQVSSQATCTRLLSDTMKAWDGPERKKKEKEEKKEEAANVHTCRALWGCYNKYSRPSLRCQSLYHQVPISCAHMYVCECACVFPALFYNPAPSVTQSSSCRVAGEEEGKLGDGLRYSPIDYSRAVRVTVAV